MCKLAAWDTSLELCLTNFSRVAKEILGLAIAACNILLSSCIEPLDWRSL